MINEVYKRLDFCDKDKTSPMAELTGRPDEQRHLATKQRAQLEQENSQLAEQLKEVVKMNTHWQRYDSQREEHVRQVTRTNQELNDTLTVLQRQVKECSTCQTTTIPNDKVTKAKANYSADADIHCNSPQAVPSSSNTQKDNEITALTNHLDKMNDKILELEKGREFRKKEDDDQLAMLREQVTVCVEDFKQERSDRERIHGENLKLRERLSQAEQHIKQKTKQLYLYQKQLKQLEESRHNPPVSRETLRKGFDVPCCYPEDRPQRHSAPLNTTKTFRHPMHFGEDLTDLPSDVEIDGPSNVPQTVNQTIDTEQGRHKEEESLQCPKCLMPFDINKHADLLYHIDTCLL